MRRARLRLLTATLTATCLLATACGGEPPPRNPRGEWRYGVTPADTTPATATGGGAPVPATAPAAPAPAPAAPPVAAPAATAPSPAAPPPSTTVTARPAATSSRAVSYRAVAVTGGGTIRGVCRLAQPAALAPVQVSKDNDRGCGAKEQPSERLVADPATLGVGNVLVGLPEIAEGKDWPEAARGDARTVLVDQQGCRYVPHVAWARPGTQLVVRNSDRADHNIHGYRNTMRDTAFNFSSEPGTTKDDIEQAFLEAPAVYVLKCDIHPWMSGYVHVVGNPYVAVTGALAADGLRPGEFVLEHVPPGEHTLVWWKEGAVETPSVADGKITAYTYSPDQSGSVKVTVAAGATASVEITIPVR